MADNVLINKATTIERCVMRARDECHKDIARFDNDLSRQDAVILNILRAYAAAQNMGPHLIHHEKLGCTAKRP